MALRGHIAQYMAPLGAISLLEVILPLSYKIVTVLGQYCSKIVATWDIDRTFYSLVLAFMNRKIRLLIITKLILPKKKNLLTNFGNKLFDKVVVSLILCSLY